MRDQIDDALNNILGKSHSNYTVEEIEKAKRLKAKNGGTLLDNLREITGKTLPTMGTIREENASIRQLCDEQGIDLNIPDDTLNKGYQSFDELQAGMAELEKNLKADFATKPENTTASIKANGSGDAIPTDIDPDAFKGVAEETAGIVFGQDDFIRKMVIAFKRPFVMPPKNGMPRNSMYIFGNEDTGRHFTLKTLVKILYGRKILRSEDIFKIDLSLYPTSTEEKLFLQDLYQALQSRSQVILFENYNACHTAYLNTLAELVITGSCRLAARYVMQNGQMVNVTNALASDAVGSLKASDKYLVFMSTNKLEKLVDCFGAPFVNAMGDVCSTGVLDAEALQKIAEGEKNELVERANAQLGFKLQCSDDFVAYSVTKSGRQAGLTGILDFYEAVMKALAQLRLERDLDRNVDVGLSVDGDAVTAAFGGESINLLDTLPTGYMGEIEAIKKEMDSIVGLTEIKEYVFSLEEYYRTQKRRREEGLKAAEVSKHMIFTGSPGTGKTTIARIISKYLKAIGVLSGGQLVEVSRADLVGRYVGHTAPLTNQVINSALGGVLFIDEAYSLYRGKDDSFGLEAIDTLVKGMEDNRDNLIVILAGYSKEMKEFLTSNSGLKSRFPNVINFPDYTGEELLAIAKINAKSKGYVIDEGAEPALLAYFNAVQAVRAADAGNGRLARNVIEEAILNQSRRLVAEPEADLCLLESGDFELDDINSK